jgi:serine/threonine protein kinase/formylglycine-generating enzyme required for sulfatase activity
MSADPGYGERLPQAVEDAVLAILEGEYTERNGALRALIAAHPRHEQAIRVWLEQVGVTVPGTAGSPPPPPADAEANGDALPMRLGAYELQAVLGRGGFGTVYRAEQLEPIRSPVAVKVLNPGMDSREVLARFSAEREALNRMDHPGIARLLDAGQTPKGRPFFVMELVEGPTLINHCREQRLPVSERLALFLMVLDAMQHAHQKAVLHRDLSSNNVLVATPEGRPQPKVIDFGIAKSLSDPLLQGGARTFQGTMMGTPEFMSPEQAAGRTADMDTRCDVYALGVQLFELLTDRLPIPGSVLRAQGLQGMAAVIANHRIPAPSEVAPKGRQQEVRGDLDAITRKALSKSRDERYGTVGEFAADLRRHLADEPVQVASPTTWYRLRKFVRRNKAVSIAVAVGGAGLLGALGVLLWALQIERSMRNAQQEQTDAITAKADAGFRLLANEERLQKAIAAEASLPPPWPEHEAAFTDWLSRHGDPLASELDKLDARLEELAARKAASKQGVFEDPADEHLQQALLRLRSGLRDFVSVGGARGRVLERLSWLREIAAPAAAHYESAWRRAIADITASDGASASAAYRGLRLPKVPGLVPLGADRRTRLFEFLDLRSHPLRSPIPARDAETGELPLGRDIGIVFVLVPGGTVRLGARRGDPGMAQNDEDADDDELRGEQVTLDEFLLARTELTAGQWARLVQAPLENRDPLMPADLIDWQEATDALRGVDMLLPTEAQWEFACRARTTTPWCTGADPRGAAACGWFGPRPQRVGLLLPNAFGLFDMHGNVAEWCRDPKVAYGSVTPRVGDGLRVVADLPSNAPRVVRGGACHEGPIAARSSAREGRVPSDRDSALGLRPVRVLRTSR